jgi:hypothetical protein
VGRRPGKSEDGFTYFVAGVVDREAARWYPNYWEYAGSFADFRWDDDWPVKYESIVDPWP